MADFGIICEFNPIHNGHIRLIEKARELGADRIVCVMSGNAVQRGELAIADKYFRAEMAVRCGADLVLELPYPYCTASAEFFARAGVKILSSFVDNIIFGSECGDIDLLTRAARVASSNEFKLNMTKRISSGEGAALSYFGELEDHGFSGLSSNDILGVEYIKAAIETNADLNFFTVKREGTGYNETTLRKEEYPSATALRILLSNNGELGEKLSEYMPHFAASSLLLAKENGDLTDTTELDTAILTFFRLHSGEYLNDIAETGGGLANRICALARETTSAKELFESLKTKKYTDAKLRRAMLFCMTGVSRSLLDKEPKYSLLLASNTKGRELLAKNRKSNGIPIVTKPADAPECEQTEVNSKLDAIFTLARKNKRDAYDMLRKCAYIDKEN